MLRLGRRNRAGLAAGLAVLLLFDAALWLLPEAWFEIVRENAFDAVLNADRLLGSSPRESAARVVVVDIDRRSLEAIGPWPWPREKMADLVSAIAAAKPAAVVIDILFSEADQRSPAALARRLATFTGRAELAELAKGLPDGDERLATALASTDAVLGFVLDPEQSGSVAPPPILMRGAPPFKSLWSEAGALGPSAALAKEAQGLGALSLPANADGVIRRVPLFVSAGGRLLPGIALEAVRAQRKAAGYAIQGGPALLEIGDAGLRLPPDGLLRLFPIDADAHAARSVSAVDLLRPSGHFSLADAVVVVGGSAPELGGLRKTPSDPLTPDAQIQADAVVQILAGRSPVALDGGAAVALTIVNGVGLVMLVAGAELPPLAGALLLAFILALLWGTATTLSIVADRLLDPLTPSLCAILVFVVSSVCSYAITFRREALIRRRFEQHLAPAVVQRIVDEPNLLKLSGERREVTALFTDVEGFTSMTHRAGPEQLVKVLDDYFEGCAAIVIAHGGMVDKIVGDAVHALFNAPLDLPDHARRAVACAVDLAKWAASYRQGALPTALGFGRTRIGIETGEVVIGDVGIRAKLDYTAHGDAINATARLEAANKDLASTICVGPVAASRCDADALRPLGRIALRGREEPYDVFEPWPEDSSSEWRDRYRAAFASIAEERLHAADLFEQLGTERPADPVPMTIAARLRSAS
jgi:adenylate cyclase